MKATADFVFSFLFSPPPATNLLMVETLNYKYWVTFLEVKQQNQQARLSVVSILILTTNVQFTDDSSLCFSAE